MRLVGNKEEYWEFIRKLRNDERVKKGFIKQGYITKNEQKEYMSRYHKQYFICLKNKKPVGYIGEVNMDIRLAVLPEEWGNGIGKFMLREFIKIVPSAYAKVKKDNDRSRKMFLSAGFTEITRTTDFYYFVKR